MTQDQIDKSKPGDLLVDDDGNVGIIISRDSLKWKILIGGVIEICRWHDLAYDDWNVPKKKKRNVS